MVKYKFDEETEVAKMELSKSATLRVTLVPASGGKTVLGIREWVDGGPGEYSGPTKKGVMLPSTAVEGLIAALKHAQKTLAEDGDPV